MQNNDKSTGSSQSSQTQGSQTGMRSQNQLETILREASSSNKFGSPNDANSFFQQHGLSVRFNEGSGSAEIIDTQNKNQKVATIQFQGQGQSQSDRQIKSISY